MGYWVTKLVLVLDRPESSSRQAGSPRAFLSRGCVVVPPGVLVGTGTILPLIVWKIQFSIIGGGC